MTNEGLVIKISVKSFNLEPKEIEDGVKNHLNIRGAKNVSLELEIVGLKRITTLNERFMHRKGPTDVLSFPLSKIPGEDKGLVGTIFVCNDIIKSVANAKKIPYKEEFLFIVRHGIDHLIGIHHK